jgi:hypothetical protein
MDQPSARRPRANEIQDTWIVVTEEHRYAQVVSALTSHRGVYLNTPRKRGFGPTALCVQDKIFAMLTSSRQFVVKLPAERVDALVMAGTGARFEPSHGQPMSQWFVAGASLGESWLLLAEESLSFVGRADLHPRMRKKT